MSKSKELRNLSTEELQEKELLLAKEVFTIVNNGKNSKKLEAPHLIRQKKKERARVLTILREKQLSAV
ncbi:MAG: rpmC [Chlamydiales bacterium]|jgi:large subunit ribosomal protein L29|nr:rpmC [Chlamydiales bacterium]